MYVLDSIAGLLAGVVVWAALSPVVASAIIRVESRYPRLKGSKSVKTGEIVICGFLFFGCVAIAVWVTAMLI